MYCCIGLNFVYWYIHIYMCHYSTFRGKYCLIKMLACHSNRLFLKTFLRPFCIISGRLETANSSFFTYDDVNTFEFYNNASIVPVKFISDLDATQTEEYVNETCGASAVNTTVCNGDMSCLVDMAATCNQAFGERTKQTKETIETEKEVISEFGNIIFAHFSLSERISI